MGVCPSEYSGCGREAGRQGCCGARGDPGAPDSSFSTMGEAQRVGQHSVSWGSDGGRCLPGLLVLGLALAALPSSPSLLIFKVPVQMSVFHSACPLLPRGRGQASATATASPPAGSCAHGYRGCPHMPAILLTGPWPPGLFYFVWPTPLPGLALCAAPRKQRTRGRFPPL